MKLLATLTLISPLLACSTVQPLAETPSYTIHNPSIYATVQPAVDDEGVPLAIPAAKDPFPWASGTGRMVD